MIKMSARRMSENLRRCLELLDARRAAKLSATEKRQEGS